jgi:amidase
MVIMIQDIIFVHLQHALDIPHITVPMGKVHELPVGFSLMTSAFKENELLAMAYAFEQASRKRTLPLFKKTLI